jgi:hypothetical protein
MDWIKFSWLIETLESQGRREQKYARRFLNPSGTLGIFNQHQGCGLRAYFIVGEST